ncbi:MAG: hypothetical protein PWP25_1901 [Sphaerochaeta sp.]|jgi:hypothetical protein|nr:hypothetical protein [Sphaerochaeta sp.]
MQCKKTFLKSIRQCIGCQSSGYSCFFLLCHFIQTRVHTFYEMANILSHLDTWHLLVKEICPDDPASMNLYREVLFI